MSKPSEEFEQAYDNFLAGCDVDTTMLDCAEFMFNAGRESAGKQAEPVAQPYAHIYEFDSAVFGTHRSFSPNQWNGIKPTRTVTVYTHPAQPVQSAGAQFRGYALLGSGNYLLNHSDDFHPELGVELIITLATEKDKEGNRQIGETRDNPDHRQPIQPEDMIIRIGFLNERGLFALENQLAEIRKQFFADHSSPPAEVVRELAGAANKVYELCLSGKFYEDHDGSTAALGELRAALAKAKEHGL